MHLAAMRAKVAEPARPMADRERLALETAATLDRAAQGASTVEGRRDYWAQAASFLDAFNAANRGHPRAGECSLQAAVYLWARAQTALTRLNTAPTDAEARTRATEELDEVVRRLRRSIEDPDRTATALRDNARYRLAQSLRDRSSLEAAGTPTRQHLVEEALGTLPEPKSSDPLAGYVALLRSEVLADLGRYAAALLAADAAAKAHLTPQPQQLLEAQLRALTGLMRFDEARTRLEAANLDATSKALLAVPVHLGRRNALPEGLARDRAEVEAIQAVQVVRRAGGDAAHAALLALARGMDRPGKAAEAVAWETLAEGRLLLGEAGQAGQLLMEGAAVAESRGKLVPALELRYRAAAVFYQAQKLGPAETVLDTIVEHPGAGPLRAKASLLLCVVAGKDAELRSSADAGRRYVAALEAHLRRFADDPTAGEARWLLGQARLEGGDEDAALAAWSAIPRASARWLDAQLAMTGVHRSALEQALAWGEPATARRTLERGRAVLKAAKAEANDVSLRDELELAHARLELVPEAGDLETARSLLERLRVRPLSVDSRQRLGLLGVALRLRAGHYGEAEREARARIAQASAADVLDLVRLLDVTAATADSDLVRRRHGQTSRLLLGPVLETPAMIGPDERKQAQILMARARLFSGDAAAARSELANAQLRIDTLPAGLLALLAETQLHLDAHSQAIAAFRQLAARNRPGSRTWLEARYGLALALERSGQSRQARQVLEATTLLHPELGGSDLRAKYERLRGKLGRS
jgi:hypothetical protein